MIGWIADRVIELVFRPQETVEDPPGTPAGESRRVALDPDAAPLNVAVNELDVIGLQTVPIEGSYEIGGGMALRHSIVSALEVTHGDRVKATAIRDAVVTDLVLRLLDSEGELRQTSDPATGQYVSRVGFTVDYRPFALPGPDDTPSAYATLTITVDCQLDR